MIYLRTRLIGFILLLSLSLQFSCNKELPSYPTGEFVNHIRPDLVKDWTNLSVDLISKSNGFNDLIASRAFFYMSITMYEALLPGLEGNASLQVKINGLNTTLPQPNQTKKYNWLIVANQALALVGSDLYKSSGNNNLKKIITLRDKYIALASIGADDEIIKDSKELGNELAWKIIEYASADGRADYYLTNYSDVIMPTNEGSWIPTAPDYQNKTILPHWGESKPAITKNLTAIFPSKLFEYSNSTQSLMWSEATEVYNMTNNLMPDEMDLIKYWNENLDYRATPLCHNMLLYTQLLNEKDIDLETAVELLLKLSIAHYDGYILAWKIKFEYNLLRPSSYIKQNMSKYFIPEFSCTPVPEFASEKALIYSANAEILSTFFGYRIPFYDLTQVDRTDIQQGKKYFNSFTEMAKEAAYSDLYSAVHFRTSIDVGFQLGYDIAHSTLALNLKK